MATQKPISTISYNSEAFLLEKLSIWYKNHIISSYQYILHKGEDGDKDHIHLRIEPNKRIDAMDLQEQLKEYQIGKEKPLGVRPFRPSKEEDWFLYAVHDEEYLRLKYNGGEKNEKLPYTWTDIKAPDDYDVEIAFIRAKASIKHSQSNITSRMISGVSPLSLVLEGENPYLVNNLIRILSKTDYERLQTSYYELQERYNSILEAIYDYGLVIVEEDDTVHLKVKE